MCNDVNTALRCVGKYSQYRKMLPVKFVGAVRYVFFHPPTTAHFPFIVTVMVFRTALFCFRGGNCQLPPYDRNIGLRHLTTARIVSAWVSSESHVCQILFKSMGRFFYTFLWCVTCLTTLSVAAIVWRRMLWWWMTNWKECRLEAVVA